jgi:hypothetical protein
MIYYVIKNKSDVTNIQLNASNARKIENVRLSLDGSKCVLKFEDSKQEYFMNEAWFSLDEIKAELEKPEWNPEIETPSFIDKTMSFLGLR